MNWSKGDKLKRGEYTIEQVLSEGGFGITYLARNSQRQRVVIKTLNNDLKKHPDVERFRNDFLSEALKLQRCTHPHIVKILDLFQEQNWPCMVLEYIDGENLAQWVVNRGVLSENQSLKYIEQIGEALIEVHRNNLLHRDIKPLNIMLRRGTSEAVLIDFGIAREFTPNAVITHTPFLSEGYAPIEQYKRRYQRGAYTDIYALAATLYTLLTGRVPTRALDREDGEPLDEPKRLNGKISDRVNKAILKGMAFQHHERPQTMEEWLELLGLKKVILPPPPPIPIPIPTPTHKGPPLWLMIAVLLFHAVLGWRVSAYPYCLSDSGLTICSFDFLVWYSVTYFVFCVPIIKGYSLGFGFLNIIVCPDYGNKLTGVKLVLYGLFWYFPIFMLTFFIPFGLCFISPIFLFGWNPNDVVITGNKASWQGVVIMVMGSLVLLGILCYTVYSWWDEAQQKIIVNRHIIIQLIFPLILFILSFLLHSYLY